MERPIIFKTRDWVPDEGTFYVVSWDNDFHIFFEGGLKEAKKVCKSLGYKKADPRYNKSNFPIAFVGKKLNSPSKTRWEWQVVYNPIFKFTSDQLEGKNALE